jgi:hypothetical protein
MVYGANIYDKVIRVNTPTYLDSFLIMPLGIVFNRGATSLWYGFALLVGARLGVALRLTRTLLPCFQKTTNNPTSPFRVVCCVYGLSTW